MTIVILYLFIKTAASNYAQHSAWVPSGEYASIPACEAAIKKLEMPLDKARCVNTGRPI